MTRVEIKQARLLLNKTRVQLAIEIGVSMQTIANWETGAVNPSDENMAKLEKALKHNVKR